MFRRLPLSLPKDPQIPAGLEQLGFFINDRDRIRMIQKPEQKYQYKIDRNDRVNDVYKEALNSCVRGIVKERLQKLGLEAVQLPISSEANEKHIPIYVSKDIRRRKRVVVIFGERNKELGIFSYRSIGEDGVKVGSAQELINAILNTPALTSADDIPGIIITNPGQLIWYRGEGRAIGYDEYLNIPRRSAVHGPFRIDPLRNRVPGNASYTDHVQYVFENVMTGIAHPEAKFDIIGLEYTGDAAIHYLTNHWNIWCSRINGICLGNPQFKLKELVPVLGSQNDFADFLAKRARAYFVSDARIETPIPGRNEHGCNCYASGEKMYEDGILIRSWKSMLDWFNMISVLDDYEEPVFTMVEIPSTSGDHD